MPLVSRTRATLRSAEFGFFGVVVYTRVHTPRRWGLPLSAGVLVLPTLSSRPLRTSCWIVGTASPSSVCGAGSVLLCYCSSAALRAACGSPAPTPAAGCVAGPTPVSRRGPGQGALTRRPGKGWRREPTGSSSRTPPGARNGPGEPRHEPRGYLGAPWSVKTDGVAGAAHMPACRARAASGRGRRPRAAGSAVVATEVELLQRHRGTAADAEVAVVDLFVAGHRVHGGLRLLGGLDPHVAVA